MEKKTYIKRMLVAPAIVGGLLLSACGGNSETPKSNTHENVTEQQPGVWSVTAKYLPNGMRELVFNNVGPLYPNIIEFCDGKDLVEESAVSGAVSIDRTPNHIACSDGKLTPDDFTSN